MSNDLEHRSPCSWCGRLRYLMPRDLFPEGVCSYCCEEGEYEEHLSRQARIDRRNAVRTNNSLVRRPQTT